MDQDGFYDAAYYDSHYGRIHYDADYYRVRSKFWRHALFEAFNVPTNGLCLDFGCGLGVVSAALDQVETYDFSPFARDFVKKKGGTVYEEPADISNDRFDLILSSHCLEHSLTPHEDLKRFAEWAKSDARFVLVLPVEINLGSANRYDNDRHMQTWTFQTITNLLLASGWQPLQQAYIYDSFALGRLTSLFGEDKAVRLAWKLGQVRRQFKSLYIISRPLTKEPE